MFVPIFLLGLGFGCIYRHFAFRNQSCLLGMAIATAILFPALQAFAMSNIKLVGGTITACLIMYAYNFYFGDRVILWLKGEAWRSGRGAKSVARASRRSANTR